MDKLVKKIILFTAITSLVNLGACENSGFVISNPRKNNIKSIDKVVRGPTGGGLGGGVVVVDNSGQILTNTRYELYFDDGFKQRIQSGYTDNKGKINLDSDKLTSDMINQLRYGSARFEINVYDGAEKSIAQGRLFINEDKDTERNEIDFG